MGMKLTNRRSLQLCKRHLGWPLRMQRRPLMDIAAHKNSKPFRKEKLRGKTFRTCSQSPLSAPQRAHLHRHCPYRPPALVGMPKPRAGPYNALHFALWLPSSKQAKARLSLQMDAFAAALSFFLLPKAEIARPKAPQIPCLAHWPRQPGAKPSRAPMYRPWHFPSDAEASAATSADRVKFSERKETRPSRSTSSAALVAAFAALCASPRKAPGVAAASTADTASTRTNLAMIACWSLGWW